MVRFRRIKAGGFVIDAGNSRIFLTEIEAAHLARRISIRLRGFARRRNLKLNSAIRKMLADGVPQTQIAIKLNVSKSYVSQLKTGRRGVLHQGKSQAWTYDRIETLRSLAASGLSRVEIAGKFPGSSIASIEQAIVRFKITVRNIKPGPKPRSQSGVQSDLEAS